MEIIGEKERLVGCNMKVVKSLKEYFNSHDMLGRIFRIEEIGVDTFNAFDSREIKIVLDDEFLKKFKTEHIVVNCRTEDEANKFCKWMHDNKMTWNTGEDYIKDNCFSQDKQNTCYTGKGFYSGFSYYENYNYTILKFSDCIFTDEYTKSISNDNNKDNKGEIVAEVKEYKIVKPFNIKDIIDKGLDSDIIEDIIFDMVENNKNPYDVFNEDDFENYEDILDNLHWFIKNGFIEEVKKPKPVKSFEPFELKIKIDNPEQLKELWCRLNIPSAEYHNLCDSFPYYVESINNNDIKNWRQINTEMYRVDGVE